MSYRVRVAFVYLLGFFIDLVNMFIANVAYPQIGSVFGAPANQLAWISNAYILGLTLVIPLSRWLAMYLGTKRLFMLSLLLFIVATVGVGAAPTLPYLIVCRLLQGVGGGLLIPIGQTMTYALYPSHQRAKLSSLVMAVALFAPALSPVIGGVVVESLSWRWVFWLSIPLALITLNLAGLWLKPGLILASDRRLDGVGLVSLCIALTLILVSMTLLGDGEQGLIGVVIFLLGLFFLIGYIHSALRKQNPLLNLRLLNEPLLYNAMLIYLFIPGMFTGVNLIAALFLQNQLRISPIQVGSLMIPWTLASFFAIRLMGKIFNFVGPRPLFLIGCVVQAAGIGLLICITSKEDSLILVVAYLLMGFGGSLCSSTAQSAAFINIQEHDLADASAIWNMNRQLSFALGIGLMSGLLTLALHSGLVAQQAYTLCFTIAACSGVVPLISCLRIANQHVISTLNKAKR